MSVAGRLLPAGVSLVLTAAHLLRAGLPLASGGALALAGLLAVRRPAAARLLQVALALASLEWLRTLVTLTQARLESGQPWLRMALILAGVILWTAWSAWRLESEPARRHFRLSGRRTESAD